MNQETGKRRALVTTTLSLFCLVAAVALVRHGLEARWLDALVAAGGLVLLLPTRATVDWMAADVREHSTGPLPWQQWVGLSGIGVALAAGVVVELL